jgi:hypothetical protein
MTEQNDDEKLLPQPHDMLLTEKAEAQTAHTSPLPGKPARGKYEFLKWPIIIFLLLLIIPLLVLLLRSNQTATQTVENPEVVPTNGVSEPTPIPLEPTTVNTEDWTNFSYTYNGQKLRLKYPPGMKVQTNTKPSAVITTKKVPTIQFTNAKTTVTVTLEENTDGTLTDWVEKNGTKEAYEPIELTDRQAIIQYTADRKNMNAFLPYDDDTIIWIRSTTNTPDEEETFVTFLNTLQIEK